MGEILLENFNGYWGLDPTVEAQLQNINLHAKQGQFIGITGTISSGKSGLLGAIIGEIPLYTGFLGKKGTIGYVAQTPFIFCTTIKENILFGKEFDEVRYRRALRDSCLL